MKPRVIGILAICTVLPGCMSGPPIDVGAAPTCSSEAQCTVMWAQARTFVLAHAGMKIQTYTADFLQTFNSTDTSIAATVNKEPDQGGVYRIAATFGCGNPFGCVPNPYELLREFNSEVAAAGSSAK
jgi:hypothetical protein